MVFFRKIEKKFTTMPLFFQVFAIACSFMFAVSVYGFSIEAYSEARVFLYSGLTGFLIFALIDLATSNRNLKESGLMQLISLLLLFILLPVFLALPTWIILQENSFLDVYVDTVGAFTTTGLPVFENGLLSKTILLWRALIAWFGGGLILIAAFLIFLPASRGGFDVFSNNNINSKLKRRLTLNERSITLNRTSKKLIPIYLGLTFILWCLLTALGTDGYTSLIRAFSILSTSGISGSEKFESDGAGFKGELVIAVFLIFALSHNLFNSWNKKKNLKKVLFGKEIRLGLSILLFVTLILTLQNMSLNSNSLKFDESLISGLKPIWGNFFTAFSYMTTNGYVSSYWSGSLSPDGGHYVDLVLLGLCLFGGGIATTAGGIKLLRISVLFAAFSNETGKLLNPSSIAGSNTNLKSLEISVFMAWIFFMLFIVSLALVTIILSMFGLLFEEALVLAIATLTTTGPLTELVGLDCSLFLELSYFSKLTLVISMVLGRLEILMALSIMAYAFRRS